MPNLDIHNQLKFDNKVQWEALSLLSSKAKIKFDFEKKTFYWSCAKGSSQSRIQWKGEEKNIDFSL